MDLYSPSGSKFENAVAPATILGSHPCELLTLSVKDLQKMHYEFPRAYFEITESAAQYLQEELMLKEEALRMLELENVESEV